MATLAQLQTRAKKLSDIVSRKVAEKAPVRTGTLKRALRRANTFDTMIDLRKGSTLVVPVNGIDLGIDYAPDDAPYGMFWNDPTVSSTVKNQKTGNKDKINFAQQALEDSAVQNALDELVDIIGEMVATSIAKEVDALDK